MTRLTTNQQDNELLRGCYDDKQSHVSHDAIRVAKTAAHLVWERYPDHGPGYSYRAQQQEEVAGMSDTHPNTVDEILYMMDDKNREVFERIVLAMFADCPARNQLLARLDALGVSMLVGR